MKVPRFVMRLGYAVFPVLFVAALAAALGISWWMDSRLEVAEGWPSRIVFGGVGLVVSFVFEVLLEGVGEVLLQKRSMRIIAVAFFVVYLVLWPVFRATR